MCRRDKWILAWDLFLIAFMFYASVAQPFAPRAAAAQTTTTATRKVIGTNLVGYSLNAAAASNFLGCLATDTGCTMEVLACVQIHGAPAGTPPVACAPLPANTYDVGVYFQRAGGTEKPSGATSGRIALAETVVTVQ